MAVSLLIMCKNSTNFSNNNVSETAKVISKQVNHPATSSETHIFEGGNGKNGTDSDTAEVGTLQILNKNDKSSTHNNYSETAKAASKQTGYPSTAFKSYNELSKLTLWYTNADSLPNNIS